VHQKRHCNRNAGGVTLRTRVAHTSGHCIYGPLAQLARRRLTSQDINRLVPLHRTYELKSPQPFDKSKTISGHNAMDFSTKALSSYEIHHSSYSCFLAILSGSPTQKTILSPPQLSIMILYVDIGCCETPLTPLVQSLRTQLWKTYQWSNFFCCLTAMLERLRVSSDPMLFGRCGVPVRGGISFVFSNVAMSPFLFPFASHRYCILPSSIHSPWFTSR
jgi:hypothetical protein